ncbi:hypothetical protein QJQ45_019443, partial [Haematococcus lacustris]
TGVQGLPTDWVPDPHDPEQLLAAGPPPRPACLTLGVAVHVDVPPEGLQLRMAEQQAAGQGTLGEGARPGSGAGLEAGLQPEGSPGAGAAARSPTAARKVRAGEGAAAPTHPPLPSSASPTSSVPCLSSLALGRPLRHLPPLQLQLALPYAYPSHAPPCLHAHAAWLRPDRAARLKHALKQQWEEAGGGVEGEGGPILYQFLDWVKTECVLHCGLVQDGGLVLEDVSWQGRGQGGWEGEGGAQGAGSSSEGGGAQHQSDGSRVGSGDWALQVAHALLTYSAQREHTLFQTRSHTCTICFEELLGSRCVRQPECGHAFCRPCLTQHCTTQVAEGQVENLRCPDPSCRLPVPPALLQDLLTPDQFKRWEQLLLQRALDKMQDVSYCPRCTAIVVEDEDHCGQCSSQCMPPAAKLERLKQRMAGSMSPSERLQHDLQLLNELKSMAVIERTAKACPMCRMSIEKVSGCNKMVCVYCNTPFCWACMKVITNGYAHFGSERCTLLDTVEIEQWERQMAANPWAVGELHEQVALGAQVARLAQQQRQLHASPCPGCGQMNLKLQRNNLIRCYACGVHHCYVCRELLRFMASTLSHHMNITAGLGPLSRRSSTTQQPLPWALSPPELAGGSATPTHSPSCTPPRGLLSRPSFTHISPHTPPARMSSGSCMAQPWPSSSMGQVWASSSSRSQPPTDLSQALPTTTPPSLSADLTAAGPMGLTLRHTLSSGGGSSRSGEGPYPAFQTLPLQATCDMEQGGPCGAAASQGGVAQAISQAGELTPAPPPLASQTPLPAPVAQQQQQQSAVGQADARGWALGL